MPRWEYLTIKVPTDLTVDEMNIFGNGGWQLVTVVDTVRLTKYYFMRPLES